MKSSLFRALCPLFLASLTPAVNTLAADAPVRLPAVEVVETPVAGLPATDRYASSLTSVSAEQLRDLNALDFASALRRTPGLTITRYNQVGSFGGGEGGAVFVRGLGVSRPGGEIKTTVDGVPKLNGVFNHPLLDLMSVDAAERIDVRARATPLDVGNTFAAVNVVTPRVTQPGTVARAQLAAGSFGTVVERFDVGAKDGAFDYYLSQSYRRSDGHRPDSDGRMENYFLRLGWTLTSHWDLSYTVNHTHNTASDPGVVITPQSPVGLMSTRGEIYQTADWLHIAALGYRYENVEGAVRFYCNAGEGNWSRRAFSRNPDSRNDWRLYGVRWRETLRPWTDGEITLGADLDYNRGTSRSVPLAPATERLFGPETLRLFSPYAGLAHTVALGDGLKLTPSAGARFYDHQIFGRRWAPQTGLVLETGRVQWHAGWSRAVNFPGLEVAALSSPVGNPALGQSWRALKPEQIGQSEIGVRYPFGEKSAVAVTAFRNDAHDRYVIVPPPPRFFNIDSYRTEGIELSVETAPTAELALFAAASALRTTPDGLPYAPRRTVTGGINWRLAPGWLLSVDATYVSEMHVLSEARSAGTTNPLTVGSHCLLNARLARRFVWGTHRGEVYVAGENLTDRDYVYRPGYPMPGINGMAGLRLEW
ncbi:MAG: TonB-dependent receptor plug domain-containing protein [Opitutae bacterium]|nr:TonB-dependent receptor plug domain-containing protein [Opitutae bacterium]